MNIVPSWVYWLVIVALTAAVGGQQMRVANLKTDLAEQVSSRATENSQRMQTALDHAAEIVKLQATHAADQQQKDDDYAKRIRAATAVAVVARADAQRMRANLAAFTASAVRAGETDAAAGQRARDRLPLVGALLAEGIELEAESREIIQRRDAEVGRLADQITIDRAACSPLVR